jgi:esterase
VPFVPAHDLLGATGSGPLALVCHGILGSRRNWRTIGRRLADGLPGWRIALVDHRNHGESLGAPAPHTVEACAGDLDALATALGAPARVIVGHSFGGKVALAAAGRRPAGLEQVWSLDAIPAAVPPEARDDSGPVEVIAAMRTVPMPQPGRRELLEALRGAGLEEGVAQWLGTNVHRGDDGLRWSVDLDAAEAMIHDYFARDLWAPVETTDPGAPAVEVVRAGQSDRWTAPILERFDRLPPGAAGRLHTLPDAGHWLHIDDPDGLMSLLLSRWAR